MCLGTTKKTGYVHGRTTFHHNVRLASFLFSITDITYPLNPLALLYLFLFITIMDNSTFDVICIGAGISGVNAGYRIQEGLPDSTYAILEARHEIGGTWSLFKYPGIRSDSDLHTFGFAFDPWKAGKHQHET